MHLKTCIKVVLIYQTILKGTKSLHNDHRSKSEFKQFYSVKPNRIFFYIIIMIIVWNFKELLKTLSTLYYNFEEANQK